MQYNLWVFIEQMYALNRLISFVCLFLGFFFPAFPYGPEVSAALLPISSLFAADSSQSPISQGTDDLLFIPLEDTDGTAK